MRLQKAATEKNSTGKERGCGAREPESARERGPQGMAREVRRGVRSKEGKKIALTGYVHKGQGGDSGEVYQKKGGKKEPLGRGGETESHRNWGFRLRRFQGKGRSHSKKMFKIK